MVCGSFMESMNKRLEVEDVEKKDFNLLLDLACGNGELTLSNLTESIELGKLADRYHMLEVVAALEAMVSDHLETEVCAEVFSACTASGLSVIEERSRALALARFEDVAKTPGFLAMREDALGSLLDEDSLVAGDEEQVFECLVDWIKAPGTPPRGDALLRKIRFPLMGEDYLAADAAAAIPESALLRDLVAAALAARRRPVDERAGSASPPLGTRAHAPRVSNGVAWRRMEGDGRRVVGRTGLVFALAECRGRVCSGSQDGGIYVWTTATLAAERTLRAENYSKVWALAAWEGRLVSGHLDGRLRVWDVAAGRCERLLKGHTAPVNALAACGARLLSASDDRVVKVWAAGPPSGPWPCERTLVGHGGEVLCLAAWRGRALSGSADRTVRVWAAATGAREATLEGHADRVTALAAHGDRVYSASGDGEVRAWAAGGEWAALVVVQAYAAGSRQYARCLAVSGSRLVGGSGGPPGGEYDVRVWDLERLGRRYALRQPAGANVFALLAVGDEVWGGVGTEVVVWGRPPTCRPLLE